MSEQPKLMPCPVCNKTLPVGDFCDDLQCPNPATDQSKPHHPDGDGLLRDRPLGRPLPPTPALQQRGWTVIDVIAEIAAERLRQVEKEGWTPEHDDEHGDGSLADAAACYAATTRPFKAEELAGVGYQPYTSYSDLWPKSWADHWFRPKRARRRKLIIAAALLVAEIERLDRISRPTPCGR